MKALLIVDMIHDFVDGKFGSDRARAIVPKIKDILDKFRKKNLIIYLRDSHKKDDPEIKVWGEHAMENTWGSEIVEELKPGERDIIIEKSTYDGFLFTQLDEILKSNNIKEIFLCGVATDICILHTSFGAFVRGYGVNIIKDACAGTSDESHNWALDYMKRIYGAKIVESEDL